MVRTKIEGNRYFAQCTKCGRWLEVNPRLGVTDCYFLNLEADFACCYVEQQAHFALEKDYEFFQG